jgi:hypothetical protein
MTEATECRLRLPIALQSPIPRCYDDAEKDHRERTHDGSAGVGLASKEPGRYKLGSHGWVTVTLGGDEPPPLDVLER